jgi:pyruvate/2-oxoglutarate dehydrogenase complex dihydrolipoamide acyltransferase (E2) component
MTKEIINIPDLGEAEDVEVIEICVKAGDQVDFRGSNHCFRV